MIACVVCGEWYAVQGRDILDICPDCFTHNFAGAQPPLDWAAPQVSAAVPLTPRQAQAVATYVRHRQRIEGTGPLEGLVTGEGEA